MEKNEKAVSVMEERPDKLLIELSETYTFEGKEIKTVDLRNLRNTTAADMIKVSRFLSMTGNAENNEELSLEYACVLAGTMTDLPIEFYKSLKARDAIQLKGRVTGFFFGSI